MSEKLKPIFSIKDILDVEIPNIEVLDIGAMITSENWYDDLLNEGLATVTEFEPNPVEYEKLCRESRKNCTWLPHFFR